MNGNQNIKFYILTTFLIDINNKKLCEINERSDFQ